jgi:uncharacterized protein YlxW (UPF0749 family)
MTADDAIKSTLAALLAGLVAAVTWLVSTVLGGKEKIVLLEARLKSQEDRVEEIRREQVTVECVREVIEEALEKRDKVAEQRREEWAKTRQLETKAVIQEELDKLVPRLAREIQGMNTGKAKG